MMSQTSSLEVIAIIHLIKNLMQLIGTNMSGNMFLFSGHLNRCYAQFKITFQYLKKVFTVSNSLSKTKINLALRNFSLRLQYVGWFYRLSGQLACYVNQSSITMEQKSSTAVSWCR